MNSKPFGAETIATIAVDALAPCTDRSSAAMAKTTGRRDKNHLCFGIGVSYIRDLMVYVIE